MKTNQSQKNIPIGWRLLPVSQIFDFVKSYAFSRDNLINDTDNKDGIGNIHYGDIHSTYFSTNIDLGKVSVPMVKDDSFKPDKKDFLKDGDLIMADVSEDYEGIGVTILVHGLGDKKIVGGLHTFVMRDNKNITDKYFRQYIFRNPKIRNSLQKIANGVSVYGVSKTSLSKLFIPVPPLSEQKRIVAVFGIWDGAIKKLEKKIEFKKQIKKGLIQDFLTGKKRLAGFGDKWKIVKLGSVCEFQNGFAFSGELFVDEGKPVIRISNIQKDKILLDNLTFFNPKDYREDFEKFKVNYGDLVIAMSGATTGKIAKSDFNKELYLNQRVGKFIPIKNFLDNDFLHYILSTMVESLLGISAGGAQPNLSTQQIKDIKLKLPNIKEQNAIADILNTANREITELEEKLYIIKSQKRYLLNNLITGEIRTPENLSINK